MTKMSFSSRALVLVLVSVSSGTTGSQAMTLPPAGSALWQLLRMALHSSLVHVVRTHCQFSLLLLVWEEIKLG
jgi:hypothetical protein